MGETRETGGLGEQSQYVGQCQFEVKITKWVVCLLENVVYMYLHYTNFVGFNHCSLIKNVWIVTIRNNL